jgi:hypothetical protein
MDYKPHKHGEAFCHMTYRSDDKSVAVRIWNSRDGVTPFVITIPGTNKQATHVEWHTDLYDPNYKPKPGDLIFVDMTEEAAHEYARINAERYFSDPKRRQYIPTGRTPDELAEILFQSYTDTPEPGPDLVRIGENGEHIHDH